MKFRHLLRLVLVGLVGAACAELDRSSQFDGFDEFLDSLMAEHGVPGLSFAAFDDREVLYHHAAGYKNQETKEIVDTQTAFEAASISKPVFAYVVLTLVRDGIVDLDMPLSAFGLGLPELTHDVRFDILTPRMLLAHLGGLPNWRARINFQAKSYEQLFSPDDTLEFVVDPNTEYRYSGEGYVLLQQVIEHVTGKGLNELAGEIVFGPLAMARSSFLYDEHIRANDLQGHDRNLNPDKWEISLALASTTLHTTAWDLAAFGVHLASGIRRGDYCSAIADPAVTVDKTGSHEKRWGLGLGVVTDAHGTYMYHGGNNVIFIADFIYGFEENLGYVLLTNGANGAAIVESIEQRVFGKDVPR